MPANKLRATNTLKISLLVAACIFVVAILSLLLLVSPAARKQELTVSAAISLKEPLTEIGAQFEKTHPGVTIVYNWGASGQLEQQIEQGAPADVFASAAEDKMDKLVGKGLVDRQSVKDFTKNRLVVIGHSCDKIHSFDDLKNVDRLSIGDPLTVPAGEYAKEALTKAKIYDSLQSGNKLVFGGNVRQVLIYVEGGNVDAGIVYSSDAITGKGISVCFTVPDTYTDPIVYPIGVIKTTQHGKVAQEFVDLVASPYGQSILKQKGFQP
ncbi:MAG TPA: molybdate ABC transporter substrate-binding protein [Planktothrix sp.]|jgi:molybdate transport system substrate-binding protein